MAKKQGMQAINEVIVGLQELDAAAMEEAKAYQDNLTKPPGSLGVLEQIAIRLAGITREASLKHLQKAVIVMAADHGVTAEGVSAFPAEVTEQMVYNFIAGGAAINVLARQADAQVVVVDIGVKAKIDHPDVVDRKIKAGTDNMVDGPAMSRAEAEAALLVGIDIANDLVASGVTLLATGDMGIGNTTASSAIVSILSRLPVADVVGAGTGMDREGIGRKVKVIERAIATNHPNPGEPLDVLAKVGGLEIAGLTGVILGAAAARVPVLIDGFISGAAALAAAKLAPLTVNYMFASHQSVEPGHRRALSEVGLCPMLHMDMRLGEGTGAVLAMNLFEAAIHITEEMATFAEAGVTESQEAEPVS